MKQLLTNLWHSFPIRLFLLHFREHFIIIGIWVLLGLMMTGHMLHLFGIRYLLIFPEYRGETGPGSFFLLGLAFGALVMTWHLVTYLIYARRFPFLAALARPFTKFSLNNSLWPLLFLGVFMVLSTHHHLAEAACSSRELIIHHGSFLLGVVFMMVTIAIYLALTNKDIQQTTGFKERSMDEPDTTHNIERTRQANWNVDLYLSEKFRWRRVRSVAHYDPLFLKSIYQQNHINALFLQVISVLVLIGLGHLVAYPAFRIPAGASLLLLASIMMALIGAISYWFGPWRLMVFVVLLGLMELFTRQGDHLDFYGVYGWKPQPQTLPSYSTESLRAQLTPERMTLDRLHTEAILEKWKARQQVEKPQFVILAASGGGSKAAYWSAHALQQLEKELGPGLLDRVGLMTGASGGMFGMALLRERWARHKNAGGDSINLPKFRDQLARDLLNSVAFSMVTTDLFLPGMVHEEAGIRIRKDRGYLFDRQLNENTDFVLDVPLAYYRHLEEEAIIPLMYITPTIINDGRRLIISAQGVSHLCRAPYPYGPDTLMDIDGVDFQRLFGGWAPDSIRVTTALRMNATFPFILPIITLPTEPIIDIMDAGIRDNFGVSVATRFIHVHREWLEANTSGVVLIHLRCWEKIPEIESLGRRGIVLQLLQPLGLLGQQSRYQDFYQDSEQAILAGCSPDYKLELVRFVYRPTEDSEPASMSFHLTNREKQNILNAWHRSENLNALQRLKRIWQH